MLTGVLPTEVCRSTEWQARMRTPGRPSTLLRKTPLPVFEAHRRAVAVVDVARAWAGKPMRITSTGKQQKEVAEFKLGERTTGKIICYETIAAACRAPQPAGVKLPRGTMRQLLLLEVGVAGSGMSGVVRGHNGLLICNSVMAISLAPLPEGALGAKAMPLPPFWLPAGGKEATAPATTLAPPTTAAESAPAGAASEDAPAVAADFVGQLVDRVLAADVAIA